MKITEYPQAIELAPGDTFIVDNPDNGTRSIKQENLPWGEGGGSVPISDPIWVSHRNTYRGKNIGSVFTDEQATAISSGTFDDLYIGDYWNDSTRTWRIVDINYYGDNENHIIVMPDLYLVTDVKFNTTNSAALSTGYANSTIRKTSIPSLVAPIVNAFFGNDHVSTANKESMSNGITNANVSSFIFDTVSIELPSIRQLNGFHMNSLSEIGSVNLAGAFSLFKMAPNKFNPCDKEYWTRDIYYSNNHVFGKKIASKDRFYSSSYFGGEYVEGTSAIRPFIVIK